MKVDPADLVALAQMLGDGKADGDVVVPDWAANAIVRILYSLPGYASRPKRGPSTSDYREMMAAGGDKPLRALAREIAEATGQKPSGVRRRLQEIKMTKTKPPLRTK